MWRTAYLIRFAIGVAFVLFASGFCPRTLAALAVVDQQYIPNPANTDDGISVNSWDWAQTFTVGISGQLTGFDVAVYSRTATTQPLLYDIRQTVGGVPTDADSGANVLASGSMSAQVGPVALLYSLEPSWLTHIDLSGAGIFVTAGDVLAIVLQSEDSYGWLGYTSFSPSEDVGLYQHGHSFARTLESPQWGDWASQDLAFQTEVIPVPEPSTLLLLATGGIGLLWVRQRLPCRCHTPAN